MPINQSINQVIPKKKSVLCNRNHPEYYNKLHKHDVWEDTEIAM